MIITYSTNTYLSASHVQLAYRCTVDTAVNKTDRMPACFRICKGNIIRFKSMSGCRGKRKVGRWGEGSVQFLLRCSREALLRKACHADTWGKRAPVHVSVNAWCLRRLLGSEWTEQRQCHGQIVLPDEPWTQPEQPAYSQGSSSVQYKVKWFVPTVSRSKCVSLVNRVKERIRTVRSYSQDCCY